MWTKLWTLPHYQSSGKSKCPGCGGKEFCTKHPTCSIITCNKNHDNVDYCFECKLYPCEKYKNTNQKDSFITYLNVKKDFEKCSSSIEQYKNELNKKISILEFLLENYNNGRLKNYYCIAVNLMDLNDLEEIMNSINNELTKKEISIDSKINIITKLIEIKAKEKNIVLKLRK